jgi:hypothetical protein
MRPPVLLCAPFLGEPDNCDGAARSVQPGGEGGRGALPHRPGQEAGRAHRPAALPSLQGLRRQ